MAASMNLVTETSFYSSRNLVTAVSSEPKNLVTVESRNFVTVMSFVSRKRVMPVPKNLATATSLCKNFVTEISLSSKNLVTETSFSSRNLVTEASKNLVTVVSF